MPTGMLNRIHQGDCIAGMNGLPAGCIDLAFADPPFNIGYEYDVYDDKKEHEHYLDWSRQWIAAVHRVLKPDGTFWLAIGDEYAAELKLRSQEIGFHCRSWVIWYYTFGVNCERKFSRSHAHLFHFVKDPQKFTFREKDLRNRVYSARQLVYGDSRANPNGRLQDDTFIIRPQDLQDCFTPDEDTWYFPRVAGTFKERAGFHGCQMPEQVLGRIIRTCSNEGEIVFDPFAGSATTLAVAKKLGRKFFGFELSKEYADRGTSRLDGVRIGDELEGSPEPTVSAPTTALGRRLGGSKPSKSKRRSKDPCPVDPRSFAERAKDQQSSEEIELHEDALIEAFSKTNDGFSLDRVIADPELATKLALTCRRMGLVGDERVWNHMLFNMRKAGRLKHIPTARRTELSWQDCDQFLFASEIAIQKMLDEGVDSLDEVLCDPELASRFDKIARNYLPLSDTDVPTFRLRWAALKLRKEAKFARSRAHLLSRKLGRWSNPIDIKCVDSHLFPEASGLYKVGDDQEILYVGEALNLRRRLTIQFSRTCLSVWRRESRGALSVQTIISNGEIKDLLGYQSRFVAEHRPRLNFRELAAV